MVTETVFAIPGVGRLVIDSVQRHDYPVIQSVLLLSAGVYVLINLLIDLSYRFFDPRIQLLKKKHIPHILMSTVLPMSETHAPAPTPTVPDAADEAPFVPPRWRWARKHPTLISARCC